MLLSLQLRHVGPAPSFNIEFSDRLNLFTGDNGLGKTFILDIAWWALTRDWPGPPALPRREEGVQPQIEFRLLDHSGLRKKPIKSHFDFSRQEWLRRQSVPSMPGLAIYARVDGGFSVWDPARAYAVHRMISPSRPGEFIPQPGSFHFSPETLWNGLNDNGHIVCNGLIRDWVSWQNQPKTSPFDVLNAVVARLAPSPEESIEIGSPVRLSVADVRDIPTLTMPYAEVPLVHASAAMKRILSFAYLLTWTWDEHKRASQTIRHEPVKNIVLLVDEMESHLHPRWQRTLLPSLLEVGKALKADVDLQILATTHAPLVLASVEPYFDEERDSLFLFELDQGAKDISLRKLPWAMQGDAVGWLISPVFGLDQARSREAENAIEAAEAFMRGDLDKLPNGLKTKKAIHEALKRTLPGLDAFWPRWIVEAKP
jgi:AAA domain, putative AbiEii toxin, Type IV TA system/AAA domain